MRIAVAIDKEQGLQSTVSEHFGHAPSFLLVETENGEIMSWRTEPNPFLEQHQPGQIPQHISTLGAQVMICGGMGRKALSFFEQLDIRIGTGAEGAADEAIKRFLAGDLPQAEPCRGGHGQGDHHHHGHERRGSS